MNNRKNLPELSTSPMINPNLEEELKTSDHMSDMQKKQARNNNWREKFTSIFFYSKICNTMLTIQSYMVKPKKVLLFISSIMFSPMISKEINNKPNTKLKSDLNLFYNQTKAGVDTIDGMTRVFSVKRETRKWTISLFYTFLDISALNSFTICELNNVQPEMIKKREFFLYQLGCELAADYVSERKHEKLNHQYKISMNEVLRTANLVRDNSVKYALVNSLDNQSTRPDSSIGVCYLCSLELAASRSNDPNFKIPALRARSKHKRICIECKLHICKDHSVEKTYCSNCKTDNLSDNNC